jgi:hypothetical protein
MANIYHDDVDLEDPPGPRILKDRKVKCRLHRLCDACGGDIEKGELYRSVVLIGEDGFFYTARCTRCDLRP